MIAFNADRFHSNSKVQGRAPLSGTGGIKPSTLVSDQFNLSLKFSGSIAVPENLPQGYSILLPSKKWRDRDIIRAAVSLYRTSFGRTDDDYLDDDITYFTTKAQNSDLVVLKNNCTQQIVGAALLNPPFLGFDEGTLWISHFCIAQKYRNQDLGQAMMRSIQHIARQRSGIHRLKLEVRKDNPAAIGVYTKCGFRLDETFDRTAYYIYDLSS